MANVTIASSASLSDARDLGLTTSGAKFVGIVMPASWDTADLTFQGSDDNATFNNVYDDNDAEVTVQAGSARSIGFRNEVQQALSAFRFIKVRSGSAASPVTQSASRILNLLVK